MLTEMGEVVIKICIVEDEKEHYEVIKNYIGRCSAGKEVDITWVTDGIDLVDDYKGQFDIIFLDIQMKHLNGMAAAEKIREIDSDTILIFITSTVQYAVQGYSVDALGYVLKPVPFVAFEKLFEKAVRQVNEKSQKTFIIISEEDRQVKIDASTITYIESQRNNVLIHCEDKDHLTLGPLKKFEELLHNKGFSKCHNAYVVNLSKVESVTKDEILLMSGEYLPISRARKKEFMVELTNDI